MSGKRKMMIPSSQMHKVLRVLRFFGMKTWKRADGVKATIKRTLQRKHTLVSWAHMQSQKKLDLGFFISFAVVVSFSTERTETHEVQAVCLFCFLLFFFWQWPENNKGFTEMTCKSSKAIISISGQTLFCPCSRRRFCTSYSACELCSHLQKNTHKSASNDSKKIQTNDAKNLTCPQ